MAAVGGLFEVCRSLTHHNHAFILYIDPPCTTTAEYTFSKRLNSLILAIYHQTNIRVDPFACPRSHVDQVAKRVHLAWGKMQVQIGRTLDMIGEPGIETKL